MLNLHVNVELHFDSHFFAGFFAVAFMELDWIDKVRPNGAVYIYTRPWYEDPSFWVFRSLDFTMCLIYTTDGAKVELNGNMVKLGLMRYTQWFGGRDLAYFDFSRQKVGDLMELMCFDTLGLYEPNDML